MSFLKDSMSQLKSSKSTIQRIDTSLIHDDPANDTLYPVFDPDINTEDRDLVVSVKEVGILQPLCLRRHTSLPNEYIVVAGHRRLCACRIANIKEVECLILSVDTEEDDLTVKMSLVLSNRTRDRSDPAIQAKEVAFLESHMRSLKKINPERFKGFTIRAIVADTLGISERTVASIAKISNNLSPELYDDYLNGKISQKDALAEADKRINKANVVSDGVLSFSNVPTSVQEDISRLLYTRILYDVSADHINNRAAFLAYVKANDMRSHRDSDNDLYSVRFNANELVIKLPHQDKVRLTPGQIYDACFWAYLESKQQTIASVVDISSIPAAPVVPAPIAVKPDPVPFQKKLLSCVSILKDNPDLVLDKEIQSIIEQLQNRLMLLK